MFPTGPNFKKLVIPSHLDPETTNNLVDKEFKVFVMKFILAAIAVVFGIVLIWIGVKSDSTIIFSFKEVKLELNKAYPGITLSFIALILMLFSRINIKFKK